MKNIRIIAAIVTVVGVATATFMVIRTPAFESSIVEPVSSIATSTTVATSTSFIVNNSAAVFNSKKLSPVKSIAYSQDSLARITKSIKGESFDVMVAKTEEEQNLGLGGFPGLKKNEGMIFPYLSDGNYGFWMKDMLFSIDIVWLDKDSKVIWIEKDISPDTYPNIYFPKVPARAVIELPSGTVEHLGVKVGDTLE